MNPDEPIQTSPLDSLIEMGFPIEKAQQALLAAENNLEAALEFLDSQAPEERYKLVYLVRTDLGMGTGKIAAQVGHATVGAYKQCPDQLREKWENSGQMKIVLKVDSLDQLSTLEEAARAIGLLTHVVQDAGHTQVEPGSLTVCSIGPDEESKINQITGSLKLFK